jgi:hypothetical protein
MAVTVQDVSYDHGSCRVELTLPNGKSTGLTVAFSDFSYDEGIERTKQRGAERVANQATEGQYDANASVTFYRNLYDAVYAFYAENDAPMATTEAQYSFQYWNAGEAAHEDVIQRAKWQKSSFSSSEGTDPAKVPVELFVLGTIFHDGVDVYGTTL